MVGFRFVLLRSWSVVSLTVDFKLLERRWRLNDVESDLWCSIWSSTCIWSVMVALSLDTHLSFWAGVCGTGLTVSVSRSSSLKSVCFSLFKVRYELRTSFNNLDVVSRDNSDPKTNCLFDWTADVDDHHTMEDSCSSIEHMIDVRCVCLK